MEPLFTNTCEHTIENYTDALKAIVKRKRLVLHTYLFSWVR